jgi:hypothetical protein
MTSLDGLFMPTPPSTNDNFIDALTFLIYAEGKYVGAADVDLATSRI